MPEYDLRYRIQAASSQKAVALRNALREALEADGEVRVLMADSAAVTTPFAVLAYDTNAEEPVTTTVHAPDPDAAASEVASKTVKVVEVRAHG